MYWYLYSGPHLIIQACWWALSVLVAACLIFFKFTFSCEFLSVSGFSASTWLWILTSLWLPIACTILCYTSRSNRTVHFRALKLLRHWTIYLFLCILFLFLLYSLYLISEEGSIQQPKLVMLSFLWIILYIDIRRSASFFTLCIFD